jgi:hypothetical protein
MSESQRLSLVLERVPEEIHEPELAATQPLLSFDAYAAGYRVFGWLHLDADRLTDMLNDHVELLLGNVLVEDLDEGTTVAADEAVVHRDELIAVRASGPRGSAARRHETAAHPTLVEAGPYLIGGHLHAQPSANPLARVRGREPMIPLTEAWIAYRAGGATTRRRVGTIIVNRHLVTRFTSVTEEELDAAAPPLAPAAA